MKKLHPFYVITTLRQSATQIKFIVIVIAFLLPFLLQAQISGVSLKGFQACGGATIIPSVVYTTQTATPVTIYYEKMVTASVWGLEATQVYNYQTSYLIYNGNDLLAATTFRVKAVDGITGTEYISNSVTVDPATWGVQSTLPQSIATAYWGPTCGTSSTTNYIQVQNYYSLSNVRPPFTIAYKRSFESDFNYKNGGVTTNLLQIPAIVPGDEYNIRITDYCGKQSFATARLGWHANATVIQNNPCGNGQVTITPSTDPRYSGVAPYTYALIPNNQNNNTRQFSTNNVFDNLPTGTYKYFVKDACGHEINNTVDVGGGTPSGTATETNASDPCFRTITIHPEAGRNTQSLMYGLRAFTDASFTYQTDSVFTVSRAFIGNTYLYHIISACGDTSVTKELRVTMNNPKVDSVTYLGNSCVTNEFVVHVSGGNAPYQYGFYNSDSGDYVFQASDTIRNLPNGSGSNQYIQVKDGCGRIVGYFLQSPCSLFTTTGDYESKNNLPGCPNFSDSDWIDVKDFSGKLIYSINPNGNTMGTVCWGVHVEPISQTLRSDTLNGQPTFFLNRNLYIEPPANLTLTDSVSLRIYFTDAEMQSMLAILYDIYGILYSPDDLKILKKKGSPGSPADLNVINDANASPGQFTVIYPAVFKYGNNWVMEFKVQDFSEFNPFVGELEVLPLHFISFTAKQQKDAVQLNWTTASEVNTKSFDVQWSNNGTTYNTISAIASNNRAANSYVFTHVNPSSGSNYYRLKQIDKDGKYTFSKVVRVTYTNKESITVYPNPAHEKITIQLPQGSTFKSVKVFDASGRQVLQKNILPSVAPMEVDIHAMSNGWYMLQFEGATQQRVSFIKIK